MMVMIAGKGGFSPGHTSSSSYCSPSSTYSSSHGVKHGYGMTDRQSQEWAAKLTGIARRDFTTYIHPITGLRTAKGFMQIMGHTAKSLGTGSPAPFAPIKAPVSKKGQGILAPAPSFDFSNLFGGYKGDVHDPSGTTGAGGWLAMLRGKGGALGAPPAEKSGGGISGLGLGIGLILLKVLS